VNQGNRVAPYVRALAESFKDLDRLGLGRLILLKKIPFNLYCRTKKKSLGSLHCYQIVLITIIMSEINSSQSIDQTKESMARQGRGDLQSMQTSNHLNAKNYLKLSRFVKTYLKGKGKIHHLLGGGSRQGDPTFGAWDEAYSKITSWLWNSMTPKISETFMFLSTTKDIWNAARQTFSKAHDAAQIFEIKVKVGSTKQESKTVTEYATLLQNLWQKLDHYRCIETRCPEDAAILKNFIEKDRVYDFLARLNAEFDQVRVQMSSLNEIISLIRAEENRRRVMLEPKVVKSSEMVMNKES